MKSSSSMWAVISLILPLSAFGQLAQVPDDLVSTPYSGPDKTPCPAVIAASPYGDVFVGVDMQGSLGKKANLGSIQRLRDTDNDGVADEIKEFVKIDNPRGIISIGNKLIVLHCNQKDGKPWNQDITVFVDANNDGVADGPGKVIVKGVGNPKFIQKRGADHCTNNIRLGIDGWIYISVGDFGFVDAEGSDGKKLTVYGGGVARVRPDGSELEEFMHGTRNVYDVAVDPFMNLYARENNNDGVGWWIRFSHYIQTGEYGYPCLYKHFVEDMIPALGEYGGGSGTGALYLQEPGWPEKYNNQPMMADWGRSTIFIHRLKKDGASFTSTPESFIQCSQVTDLDVDGSGRMYISAWQGAGYSGNPNKGFVTRVVPKNWKYKPFPNLVKLDDDALLKGLASESATARTYVQQEILRRGKKSMLNGLVGVALKGKSLESRVAAIYTLAQLGEESALPLLAKLSRNPELREHAVRAMGDRKGMNAKADVKLITGYLKDSNPRVQVAAAVALGRIGDTSAADALIAAAGSITDAIPVKKTAKKASGTVVVSDRVTRKNSVEIDVDISQFKKLFLVVDGIKETGGDQVAWVNPVITTTQGKRVSLTKVKWKSAKAGWGETKINKDCRGRPLRSASGKSLQGIGTHANSVIEYDLPDNVKRFTARGMLTDGSGKNSDVKFIVTSEKPVISEGASKRSSTPNQAIVLPHVARQALVAMGAHSAVINALNSSEPNMRAGALYAMKFMHAKPVVDALIVKSKTADASLRKDVVHVLMRLQHKDVDYDGSTWWSTRPSGLGPYFEPTRWEESNNIGAFLAGYMQTLPEEEKGAAMAALKKNRGYLGEAKVVDKGAVKPKQPGDKTIEDTSIEDVMIFLKGYKANAANGKKVIMQVGCIACHNVDAGQKIKGPDLAKLGKTSIGDIAEGILKPGATIAESWVSLTLKNGTKVIGTLNKDNPSEYIVTNVAGVATKVNPKDIQKTEPGPDQMLRHLCDKLTLKQFADLCEYIKLMDKRK